MFSREGYAGASMDRVAAEAHVSKPTLYSHFENKKTLFLALFEWLCGRYFQTDVPASAPDALPAAWLERRLEHWLLSACRAENVFFLQIALGESARLPQLGELYLQTAFYPLYDDLLTYFQAHPQLPIADPEVMAAIFCAWAFAFVVFSMVFKGAQIVSVQRGELVKGLLDLALGRCPLREPVLPPPNLEALLELQKPPDLGPEAEKREQLLHAAMNVFIEHGYAGTSMDMVALSTGVSKPTLYNRFQDKEGLFSELIARVTIRRLIFPQYPALLTQPPLVLLRKQARAIITKLDDREYLSLMRLILGESARFPELAQLYTRTVIQPGHLCFSAYLSTCALRVPAPPISALLYIGSLIGFVLLRALLQGDRWLAIAPERYVDCLVGMMAGQTDQSS